MTKVRKRHNAEFKSKVAVEAIKEHKTINELTAEYGVHATHDYTFVGSHSSNRVSNARKYSAASIASRSMVCRTSSLRGSILQRNGLGRQLKPAV